MPSTHRMESRRDVVQVTRNREPGVTLEMIAPDSGIHPITPLNCLKCADTEAGVRSRIRSADSVERREANKRIGPLEQKAEVLNCALV